jgi:hypothetical protein
VIGPAAEAWLAIACLVGLAATATSNLAIIAAFGALGGPVLEALGAE